MPVSLKAENHLCVVHARVVKWAKGRKSVMVGKRGAPDWLLVMGELRLAAVRLDDVDQPWYRCTLEPTADVEAVRPLLEATGETEDEDRFIEVVEEMAARGVRLIWASGAAEPRPDLEG